MKYGFDDRLIFGEYVVGDLPEPTTKELGPQEDTIDEDEERAVGAVERAVDKFMGLLEQLLK